MSYYWVECQNPKCGYKAIAPFVSEFGYLVCTESYGEECIECGSGDVELGEEYCGGGQ